MRLDFSPRKVPRQARSRATFDAIVEACAQLLVEHGYGAVTTNHIAETAGVSIGSLYEYFGDTDAVVFEVVRRTTEGFVEDAARPVAALVGAPVDDAIRSWLAALLSASPFAARAQSPVADPPSPLVNYGLFGMLHLSRPAAPATTRTRAARSARLPRPRTAASSAAPRRQRATPPNTATASPPHARSTGPPRAAPCADP